MTIENTLLKLIVKHRANGILLDTNVLLLFIFAINQPNMIGKKRLEKYLPADGELLVRIVTEFDRILTTTHVLAETSNLIRQIVKDRLQAELLLSLHPMFCLSVPESYTQIPIDGSNIDVTTFTKLGLTDSALASLVNSEDRLLLTDDFDLYMAANKTGENVINFTHLREASGIV